LIESFLKKVKKLSGSAAVKNAKQNILKIRIQPGKQSILQITGF